MKEKVFSFKPFDIFLVMASTDRIFENEFLNRKIGEHQVVWLAGTNQFVGFEEPAFFVFDSWRKNMDRNQMVNICSERYRTSENESRIFVDELIERIESLASINQLGIPIDQDPAASKEFIPQSVRTYRINNRHFCFFYESVLYENIFHPLLEHLEVEDRVGESVLVEIFGEQEKLLLRVNHLIKGRWGRDETHLFKGAVFLEILNGAYKKLSADWMAVLHASAISNGSETIVFPAAPGSGKSTLAALLVQKGYKLVSDDFVPIDPVEFHAFPFHLALSVKEGSSQLLSNWYPSLREQALFHGKESNKQVKYLPLEIETTHSPVHKVVFIKYDRKVDYQFNKIENFNAMKMLLKESWISPSIYNAKRFFDWFSQINCYQLVYSDHEKALLVIDQLFNK